MSVTMSQIRPRLVLTEIPSYLSRSLDVMAYRSGHVFGQRRFLIEQLTGTRLMPLDNIPPEFADRKDLMELWVEGQIVGWNVQEWLWIARQQTRPASPSTMPPAPLTMLLIASLLILALSGCTACRHCADEDPNGPAAQKRLLDAVRRGWDVPQTRAEVVAADEPAVPEPGEALLTEVYGSKLPAPGETPICQGGGYQANNPIEQKTGAHNLPAQAVGACQPANAGSCSSETETIEDPRYVDTKLAGRYYITTAKTH